MFWEFENFTEIITGEQPREKMSYKKVIVITIITFILFVIASLIFGHTNNANRVSYTHNEAVITIEDYTKFDKIVTSQVSEKYNRDIVMYDSSELSIDIIESRNGKVIVERCVCYVDTYINGDGSGTILNAFDEDYSYMHYSGLSEEINIGTIVVSYFVYNPDTNYVDDTTDIYDFVLTREFEVSQVE